MPLDVLCAQLTRDLFAIAKFLFQTKRDGNIPVRTPLTGASNAGGYEKTTIIDQSRFISEMIQDRAIVTMESE